jgi:N-acetyl-gamma-glutamyl-phosphate reductase
MINVAIVGASGYTGLELIKIIHTHPEFNLSYVANSEGDISVEELHPSLHSVVQMDVQKANPEAIAKVADLCFLALPHKTAMSFAKELIALDVKVVDLSADYRLELETYEKYYCPHEDKQNLPSAVYGLPEFYKEDIKKATLVANPGCYPTAALLAIIPFAQAIQKDSNIFIDAKSGVSGAGKKLVETTQFVTVNDNIFAYNPMKHRHGPEINEKIKLLENKEFNISFVPQLIPATRGMMVNVYATLSQELNAKELLENYYTNNPFVRVKNKPVDIKSVAGTNFCDIFVEQNGNVLFINATIDNLLRGASSQAVVNANLMCGFEEELGINTMAYVP